MNKMMHFNEYQNFCQSVRLPTATPEYCLLNLSGEVGELHSLVAKGIRDGRKFDYDLNIKKELGDALWSIATIALDHGFTLQDIADGNVSKLSKRKQDNTLTGSGDNR
jgi:NTP pyrophosphatase (non-canonical NTP hydrolase)